MSDEHRAALAQKARDLPRKPGIYLMRDAAGTIIYVGKAVNLRNRVGSYFTRSGQSPKVTRMVEQVADVDYVVTSSEMEALLTECNYIKRYRPRYNVRLRDDKQYPYIKVSLNEEWPRVYVTRKVQNDGARYFGPFTNSKSVWQTLDLVNKLFPYRSCDKPITGTDPRPCLDYHIKRCLGPCIGAVSRETYRGAVDGAVLFLEGKQGEVLKDMRRRMEAAAEALEFERAAFIRDQIQAVERVVERQKVLSADGGDQDAIALARDGADTVAQVFFIRGGKLIGTEHFVLDGTAEEDEAAVMTGFVTQFYDSNPNIPPEILLQHDVTEPEVITEWLRTKRGDRVALRVPRRGEKRKLVDLVAENARETLAQLRLKWLADAERTGGAVAELAEQLGLDRPPRRIECYDNSNIQGTSPVSSMVVFVEGKPRPDQYRRFSIKTVVGADDFATMQEVLRRRFRRAGKSSPSIVDPSDGAAAHRTAPVADQAVPADEVSEREEAAAGAAPNGVPAADADGAAAGGADPKFAELPDLIIIDGGKGQLSAALEALWEVGVTDIPVVALAKENEEIYRPGSPEPQLLPRTSQALYLVQRIRDEAHRFALTYHRQKRSKIGFESLLDGVPGVGPRRKAQLLRRFGSLKAIRDATVEELAATPGMTRAAAEKIKELL